jgi:hypothetical protein
VPSSNLLPKRTLRMTLPLKSVSQKNMVSDRMFTGEDFEPISPVQSVALPSNDGLSGPSICPFQERAAHRARMERNQQREISYAFGVKKRGLPIGCTTRSIGCLDCGSIRQDRHIYAPAPRSFSGETILTTVFSNRQVFFGGYRKVAIFSIAHCLQ